MKKVREKCIYTGLHYILGTEPTGRGFKPRYGINFFRKLQKSTYFGEKIGHSVQFSIMMPPFKIYPIHWWRT